MNNLIARYSPLFFQLVRFGIVGVTAASINFSVVVFLVQNFSYPPLLANVFGFLVSFQMSYWGHRLWTFNATAALHRVAFPKLALVQIGNFCGSEYLYYIFLSYGISYQIGLLCVLCIMPIFTFLTSKLWVFR